MARRGRITHLLSGVCLLALMALMAGCVTADPQSTLAPAGDVARKIRTLWNIVLWPLIGLFFIVEGALVIILFRYRRRRNQDLPRQVHGNTKLEVAWTIAPALFLIGITIPTIWTITALANPPPGDAVEVKVTAFQWSWTFEYPQIKDAQGKPLTIVGKPDPDPDKAPVMHVPLNRPIKISVEATDVIHSFWVPKLAGKIDAIPGRVTTMWFNATEPGTYNGQCAEFCGVAAAFGHWTMRFKVVAQTQEEFDKWAKEQLATGTVSLRAGLTWYIKE